jgi:uncharacterized protein (DUF433 family)
MMDERIEVNPLVCNGNPVIKGTRVMVMTILSALSAGDSFEIILEDHPALERADIDAAIAFGSKMSNY